MKTLEISAASKPLSEYAEELEDVLVLTSQNKPIAALVSLKKVDRETLSLSTSSEFMEIIESAREEFKSGRKVSLEELKRDVLS